MSNQDNEVEPETGVGDDDLPEDLQPTDENPLAKPLTEDDDPKSPEELDVLGGKTPEESGSDDSEGEEGDSEG